jgi:hypothetical protein
VHIFSTKECLNGKKSKVMCPEFVNNHLLHVGVLPMRIWREAVVRPPPSYVATTAREIDNLREILSK